MEEAGHRHREKSTYFTERHGQLGWLLEEAKSDVDCAEEHRAERPGVFWDMT